MSSDLDVTYGIRYEKHGVPEGPPVNAGFEATYGYTNALTYDGANYALEFHLVIDQMKIPNIMVVMVFSQVVILQFGFQTTTQIMA